MVVVLVAAAPVALSCHALPQTEGLAQLIRKFVRHGMTVALIEHKMGMIMSLADKILVLSYGEKIAEGTPDEIRRNPAVIDAYLGSEHAEV